MKKYTKILIFVSVLAIGAGGFFVFENKESLLEKKVAYNSISDLQNSKDAEVSQQEQVKDGQAVENIQEEKKQETGNLVEAKQTDDSDKIVNSSEKTSDKKVDASAKTETSSGGAGKIVNNFVSFGFQKSSGRTIKAIIIHTSYNALGGDVFDFDKVMQEWKDAGVAPHYAIDRKGTIHQLVADQNIAWHAGNSKLPDGTTDVNGVSIGIEMINDQDSKFTSDQYKALNSLIATLKSKYAIKYVLGHDDIAPGRKTDPWGIEWNKVQK